MADAIPVHDEPTKVGKKVTPKTSVAADPELIADLTEQIEARLRAEREAAMKVTADSTYRGEGAEIAPGIVRVDH